MPVKKIEIRERQELEPILVSSPELIEEGLRIVAHQLPTPTGPLDILAIDDGGALVVIELKNEVDDGEGPLLQALRYYDWVVENRAWIAHVYRAKDIDPQKDPRLALVAPDFSDSLKRLAKYLAVETELYRYQAIELPSGERTIVVTQTYYPDRAEVPRITTVPQSAERIQDADAKKLYLECLDQLTGLGLELQARANDTVSAFYKGRRVLRIYPKRSFFGVRLQHADSSMTDRIRIKAAADWGAFLSEHLRPRLDELAEE
ncbi:MAG: endonuclease NucS [Anaerolineae bacterium]|nr:endonuclease NucS [Anaerolineae bacterium]